MHHFPYCFVLMPFGVKPHPAGGAPVDFDRIYEEALAPAITSVELQPYRDDLTAVGGIVQKQIYEALLLCDFAIADLTIENSNVFYELGVRHAARPASTLAVTARPESIPFDVAHLRSVRYELDSRHELTDHAARALRERVSSELWELRATVRDASSFSDSPLFQLIEGWRPARPTSLKTDLFARRAVYEQGLTKRLSLARAAAKRGGQDRIDARADVVAVERELGDTRDAEAGLLVTLLLTYRALEDWDAMVRLAESMPGIVRERATVREQLAFALNRRAGSGNERDADRGLALLQELVDGGRATAETYGLIGRIHKDRWRRSVDLQKKAMYLADAVDAYSQGFRLDPCDVYPGINAVSLSLIKGEEGDRNTALRLLPVVEYAAERLLLLEAPTYWMHATLLETSVIRRKRDDAFKWLRAALRQVRESWEPKSTAQNLTDLLDAGVVLRDERAWVEDLRGSLLAAVPA